MTSSARFAFIRPRLAPLALVAAVALPMAAGAATPIKVTRFHLDQAITPGTIRVEIAPDATVAPGPEAQAYIDAVSHALATAGFTPVAATPDAASDYRAVFTISRTSVDLPPAAPPVSIGLGGGGGNGGFGLGGSFAFGVGKRKQQAEVTTQLSLRIMRASTPDVIWEGRAQQVVIERGKLVQPAQEAEKLARAMFKGFPGQSGRTITVK